MQVRVTDVKKWIGREEMVHLSEPWPQAVAERVDGQALNPASVWVRVRNTGPVLIVETSGEAEIRTECSRCLAGITIKVPFSVTDEFREESGPSDPNQDYLRYTADHIELDTVVADSVALAMPLAPLCKADCKGLCPRCGADLNEGPCSCQTERDPRWEGLQGWHSPAAGTKSNQ